MDHRLYHAVSLDSGTNNGWSVADTFECYLTVQGSDREKRQIAQYKGYEFKFATGSRHRNISLPLPQQQLKCNI